MIMRHNRFIRNTSHISFPSNSQSDKYSNEFTEPEEN